MTPEQAKEIMRMYTFHELQETNTKKKLSSYESIYAPPSSIGGIAYAINDAKVNGLRFLKNPVNTKKFQCFHDKFLLLFGQYQIFVFIKVINKLLDNFLLVGSRCSQTQYRG